jgi:hypothetical protein
MKDYYYLIDNVDHFSIVEGGLRWCGFKPGYQLDADELNKLPKLSEAEVYEEIQTRIRT